jgi:hypothetical protein
VFTQIKSSEKIIGTMRIHTTRHCSKNKAMGHVVTGNNTLSSSNVKTVRSAKSKAACEYIDWSNEEAPEDFFPDKAQESKKLPSSFPWKLYNMLVRVEMEEGERSIVSWQPHGRCFKVNHTMRCEFSDLLLKYMDLSKLTSFQRQLNLYGFKRISSGEDKGGYYHEFFLRGMPFLLPRLCQIKIKGTKVRSASDPEKEPNFWRMPWVIRMEAATSYYHEDEEEETKEIEKEGTEQVYVSDPASSESEEDEDDKSLSAEEFTYCDTKTEGKAAVSHDLFEGSIELFSCSSSSVKHDDQENEDVHDLTWEKSVSLALDSSNFSLMDLCSVDLLSVGKSPVLSSRSPLKVVTPPRTLDMDQGFSSEVGLNLLTDLFKDLTDSYDA